MPLLFSYGTLQEEAVQLSVFGRRLEGHRDVLPGYELKLVEVKDFDFVRESGKAMHKMLQFNGGHASRIEGMVYEVSEVELRVADDYEPEPWQRILTDLESGSQAWVYVDSRQINSDTDNS